ncbi:transporter substrate-binding domain-containing protein [Pseudomonas sp. SA3-5]|uniref:Transporter substrate-binding domain-containing protein n=1 Tax=Pseudomonas aestuarii TaxID=3018340 RepID=A0ABT4XL37_9PSED|nr:transporter substrate-binding domain-containing protein [Pseudomonas aestuarii]MDA7088942.1 transporter substrate-binding domain-containing protein [Pseudomonas aestuarii]
MNGLRALCLSFLLVPLGVWAQTLRLVADPWPPFNDQTLLNNGVASDLVSSALGRAGYATTYGQAPWERAVRGLQRSDYDVLINAWYTEERAGFGYFSQPYLINRIRLLRRKGSAIRFEQLSDLYSQRIAVVRGYAYSAAFNSDPRLYKVGVGSFVSAARMVQAKRVELTLEDEIVARYHLGRELSEIRDELEFVAQPLSENGLHILIRRSHPQHQAIAEAFDRAIVAMHADGSYAAILQRHGL